MGGQGGSIFNYLNLSLKLNRKGKKGSTMGKSSREFVRRWLMPGIRRFKGGVIMLMYS